MVDRIHHDITGVNPINNHVLAGSEKGRKHGENRISAGLLISLSRGVYLN